MSDLADDRSSNKFLHRNNAGSWVDADYAAVRESTFRRVLRWHKATVCIWAAAGFAVAQAYLLLSRPEFTATAELLLGVGSGMPPRIADDEGAQTGLVENEIQTLRTERLATAVIGKLGLWNDAELAEAAPGPLTQILELAAGRDAAAGSIDAKRDVVLDRFKEATDVVRSGESYVARVSFSASDPHRAAAVANSLATAYVDYRTATQARNVDETGERMEGRIARLREKAAAASAALNALRNNSSAIGAATRGNVDAKLRQLESQAQAYRSLYQRMLGHYARTLRERSTPVSEARIISGAVAPSRWSSPKTSVVLLLATFAGGLLGIAVAARRERTKRPIRSLGQIENEIGVPALGVVPLVQGRRLYPAPGHAPPLLLRDKGDALRGVRLAVSEMCGGHRSCVVGVISARREEGKSTIAFNLAVMEAESGKRVILIDANLHRPALARSLPCGALLAPLEERAAISGAVAANEFGFDLLGERSTDTPIHPAVLLGSPAMHKLIASARERYDFIVCDLPNVQEHIDARAAADLFDAFVLVTEWGCSPTGQARAALKSPAIADRLVGALINKVPRGTGPFT
jgi:polysaccharide biosynthesis transport protein